MSAKLYVTDEVLELRKSKIQELVRTKCITKEGDEYTVDIKGINESDPGVLQKVLIEYSLTGGDSWWIVWRNYGVAKESVFEFETNLDSYSSEKIRIPLGTYEEFSKILKEVCVRVTPYDYYYEQEPFAFYGNWNVSVPEPDKENLISNLVGVKKTYKKKINIKKYIKELDKRYFTMSCLVE